MVGRVVIKLGGSAITYKSTPLTENQRGIDAACIAMVNSNMPLVVVHGGGSFGHFYAREYHVGTTPIKLGGVAVSDIHWSMHRLNLAVIEKMREYGMTPYSIPPNHFMRNGKADRVRVEELGSLNDVTPVSYGDVIPYKERYHIISGDSLVELFARVLHAERVVFTMDVEGIYLDYGKKHLARRISRLDAEQLARKLQVAGPADATGGIGRKLKTAARLAEHGIDVAFVKALRHVEVSKALKGETFHGTLLKGERNALRA
jgi:isopentenyl phosphate kinase